MNLYLKLLILVLLVYQIPFADAVSTVRVQPVTQDVIIGKQFTVELNVTPGVPIAGMQSNIIFNPAYIRIDSITFGNLFTQDGASEFSRAGVINNTAGTVVNIWDVILGPYSVNNTGTFIRVNGTALAKGTSGINLTNIIIAKPDGTSESLSYINGTVVVKYPNWDVNEDGIINILDIQIVASHFGEVSSGGRWDVNGDAKIDVLDLVMTAGKI